ncbi:MAG: O-antigen ligase family protein [Pseudomonadota bacterium]
MPQPRPNALVLLLAAYAALPALGGLLWLALGDDDPLRNRAPLDLLPIWELAVILVALRTGFSRRALAGILSPFERLALILFAAVALWGITMVAVDPAGAAERAGLRLLHVATGLALAHLLWRAGRGTAVSLALIAQPLVYLPVLALLYALYAGDPTMNWLGGPVGYWHVRIWGMSLAVALAAAAGLYAAAAPDLRGHLVWVAILVLLAAQLCFSGFRGGAAAVPVALALMTLVRPRRMLARLPAIAGALAAGAALSLAVPAPIEDYGLLHGLIGATPAWDQPSTVAGAGRMEIWSETLRLIGERPFLGYGHDQFGQHFRLGGLDYVQPHSAPLNVLFDFGLVGGAALTAVMVSLWAYGVAAVRTDDGTARLGAFGALQAVLAMALVDGALYHPEPLAMCALALTGLLAGTRRGGLQADPEAANDPPDAPADKGARNAQDQR